MFTPWNRKGWLWTNTQVVQTLLGMKMTAERTLTTLGSGSDCRDQLHHETATVYQSVAARDLALEMAESLFVKTRH